MPEPNDPQGQIADMLNAVEGPSDPVEPSADPVPQPEPVEPAPAPEPEPQPEPVAQSLEDLVASLQTEIASLKAQLTPKPTPEEPPIAESDFQFEITQEQVDEALYDPGKLHALLTGLVDQMKKESQRIIQEVPRVVGATAARQAIIQQTVATFKATHPKLNEPQHADYLAWTTQQVEAENPAWTPQQVLDETATRMYRNLGIAQEAAKIQTQSQQEAGKPAFASRPGSSANRRAQGDTRTQLQKEIDEMLAAIN